MEAVALLAIVALEAGILVLFTLAVDAPVSAPPVPAVPAAPAAPAAAVISSAVASGTNRFCVKMQPCSSSSVSHELPLAVGSLTSPGAKVPALRAC